MRLIANKQENKEEFALVTVISSTLMNDCRPGAMMAVDQYGLIAGSDIEDSLLQEAIRKEAERCISKGLSRKQMFSTVDGSIEVFINALCHKERLIIVGSGNLVQDVYQIALTIGYNITIVDSHAETLTRARFPQANQLLLGDVVELLKTCEIDESTSIVLASHHHEWDQAALETVITTAARYIGAVGNKRKVTRYLSGLSSLDISDEQINRVHMPVGLDLGGQKTSDIALAILAEIQAVKYQHSGGFVTIKHSTRGIDKREELY
jgi:xanthine dehydrogenase accessory factor